MLTAEKIQEIADGCEGVSLGPWAHKIYPNDGYGEIHDATGRAIAQIGSTEDDVRHLGHLDPTTVRALCSLALDGLRMREEHARLTKLVAISDRRRIASTKAWMSAAEKALSGDMRSLRLIVDLANAPPVAVVLSEDKPND